MIGNIAEDIKPLAKPLHTLNLLDKNPRIGNIDAVVKSYQQFGQLKPIVATPDGTVIAGNHQLQAAHRLGWTHIAVVTADVDPTTAKAFALADNRVGDLGHYNETYLHELIQTIQQEDATLLTSTGYSSDDIAAILGVDDPIKPKTDIDDAPPVPTTTPITQLGDVWKLGKHRLVCGDATNPETVRTALNNQQADLVIIDPPYNIDYTGWTKDKLTMKNDKQTNNQFRRFLSETYTALLQNTKPGHPIYVFHSDTETVNFREELVNSGWLFKQNLVWIKSMFVIGRQDYQWQHEPILYGWKPGAPHVWYGMFDKATLIQDDQPDFTKLTKQELQTLLTNLYDNASDIIREKKPARNREHPTMKPVRLVQKLLANSATTNSLILDTFAGSGTTLIAAHDLNMRCATVELDPKYADVVCRRYQQATGTIPILEQTNTPVDFCEND